MPDAFSTFVRHRPDPEWIPCLADALETNRKELCHLAVRTWQPIFYAELMKEA